MKTFAYGVPRAMAPTSTVTRGSIAWANKARIKHVTSHSLCGGLEVSGDYNSSGVPVGFH